MPLKKYRNKISPAFGYFFRSQAEKNHAMYLTSLQNKKNIREWHYELPYSLIVNNTLIARIFPDFTVIKNDETKEIHEVKGGRITMTPDWRIKRKLFIVLYPDIKYRVFDGKGNEIRMRQ